MTEALLNKTGIIPNIMNLKYFWLSGVAAFVMVEN